MRSGQTERAAPSASRSSRIDRAPGPISIRRIRPSRPAAEAPSFPANRSSRRRRAALRAAHPRPGGPRLQLRLDGGPDLRIDDRRMPALVDARPVPDAAGVDRICQQVVQVPAMERQAARPRSIPGAALLRAKAQAIGLGLHLPDRSVPPVEGVERPDRPRLGLVDAERAPVPVIAERHDAAHPEPLSLGGGDLVPDALGRHLALELRKGEQHMERQPPHAGRGVEGLGHRDEARAGGVEPVDDLRKAGEGPGQPVELVDHDPVDETGIDVGEQALQARALQGPARDAPSS